MKGKMIISSEEVRGMVEGWCKNNALTLGRFRITQIKSPDYSCREPSLEIEFTNEPEEGLPEGGE